MQGTLANPHTKVVVHGDVQTGHEPLQRWVADYLLDADRKMEVQAEQALEVSNFCIKNKDGDCSELLGCSLLSSKMRSGGELGT